jgi:hypothetical protein
MANRYEIEALEQERRREWMDQLSTQELLDGLALRSFRGGGNTVAREILRERNVLPDRE